MSSIDLASANLQNYTLFDKVIRVYFFHDDGTYDLIDCPPPGLGITQGGKLSGGTTGRKPTIRLKGSLVSTENIIAIELRITNLYVPQPLSSYVDVKVEAGYRGSIMASFTGQIKLAYQELPGPDAVTCFQLFVGNIDSWLNTSVNLVYQAGVSLSSVLSDIAQRFGGLTVYNSSNPAYVMKAALPFAGYLKDIFPILKGMFMDWALSTGPDQE